MRDYIDKLVSVRLQQHRLLLLARYVENAYVCYTCLLFVIRLCVPVISKPIF